MASCSKGMRSEKAKIEARCVGHTVNERTCRNGAIKLRSRSGETMGGCGIGNSQIMNHRHATDETSCRPRGFAGSSCREKPAKFHRTRAGGTRGGIAEAMTAGVHQTAARSRTLEGSDNRQYDSRRAIAIGGHDKKGCGRRYSSNWRLLRALKNRRFMWTSKTDHQLWSEKVAKKTTISSCGKSPTARQPRPLSSSLTSSRGGLFTWLPQSPA